MEEKRYIISDASKLIEVEAHVLRYWEEELDISIPRNEMGHRYYTDFYIDLFKKIKELKDSGFQLKAIKILVPELMNMYDRGNESVDILKEELFSKLADISDNEGKVYNEDFSSGEISTNLESGEMGGDESANNNRNDITDNATDNISGNIANNISDNTSNNLTNKDLVNSYNGNGNNITNSSRKLEQFQTIISEVVSNALKENTGLLGKEVSEIVSDNVIKEMDYLMHIREKQEEERFKKLDEAIRSCQMARKETAKTGRGIIGKLKRLQN